MNSDDEITLDTEDVVETIDNIDETIDNDDNDENVDNDETEEIDIDEAPTIHITDIVIEPNMRISKNKLTRYEFVRIIGERVVQLTKGAKPLIKQSKESESFTNQEIAIEELKTNMIPFKIKRFVKDHYEIWSIDELSKQHLESFFH